jgi:uncharacterized membrane protein YagU involved in acid resistance
VIMSAKEPPSTISGELLRGAVAGAVATGVMTVVMTRVAPALLPASAQLPVFPPRRVVQRGEELAGDPNALTEREEDRVTMVTHYGYGSAAGAVYALLRARVMPPGAGALAGAAYGLAVWAVGYAGWLPLAGIRQSTVRDRPRRWLNPILSHLAFGISVAVMHRALRRVRPPRP